MPQPRSTFGATSYEVDEFAKCKNERAFGSVEPLRKENLSKSNEEFGLYKNLSGGPCWT